MSSMGRPTSELGGPHLMHFDVGNLKGESLGSRIGDEVNPVPSTEEFDAERLGWE
jgi:hypothetical protein